MSEGSKPLQQIYRFIQGRSALIVSMPHVGTQLPAEIVSELTSAARKLPDTDWHVDRLYDFVVEEGATLVAAHYSRYVIDLNRPPDDTSLYPGQTKTGLCPMYSFDGEPLYRDAAAALPPVELDFRREHFWRPYHEALAAAIAETRRRAGCVLLLDAHSIRSEVPRLFPGRLPDINLGTDDGRSCDPRMIQPLLAILGAQQQFSFVLNGRFKGGYITRHYGCPRESVHALQIELAECSYMDEQSTRYDAAQAQPLRALLKQLIGAMLEQVPVLQTS